MLTNHLQFPAILHPANEVADLLEGTAFTTDKLGADNSLCGLVVITSLLGKEVHSLASAFLLDADGLLVDETIVLKAVLALQVQGVTAELFTISLHEKTVSILNKHPIQVRGHFQ